jgi:hypothetical protein
MGAQVAPVIAQVAATNKRMAELHVAPVVAQVAAQLAPMVAQVAAMNERMAELHVAPVAAQVAAMNKRMAELHVAPVAAQVAAQLAPMVAQVAAMNERMAELHVAPVAAQVAAIKQAIDSTVFNQTFASSVLKQMIAASIAAKPLEPSVEQTGASTGPAITLGQWMLIYWSILCVIFILALYWELQVLNGPDNWIKATLGALDRLQLGGVYSPAAVAFTCGQLFKRYVPRPPRRR